MPSTEKTLFVTNNIVTIIGIIGVLGVLALTKVEYLLGVYCSFYFLLHAIVIGSWLLLHITVILVVIGAAFRIWQRSAFSFAVLYDKLNVVVIIFILDISFSLFIISPDLADGILKYRYFIYFAVLPFFLVQLCCFTYKHLSGFIYAFIISALLVAIITYTVFDVKTMLIDRATYRLSLLSNPITFSTPFAISCIFLVYSYLKTHSYFYRFLISLSLTINVLLVALTGTRQSLFGLLVCAPLLFWVYSAKRIWLDIIVFICVGAIVYSFIDLTGVTGLGDRYSESIRNPFDALDPRFHYYIMAIEDFLSSPLIGIGFGSFGEYYLAGVTFAKDHAHNVLLEVMAEEGLLGAALLGAFFYLVCRMGIQLTRSKETSLKEFGLVFFFVFIFAIIQSMFSGGVDDSIGPVFWSASALKVVSNIIMSDSKPKHGQV